MSTPEQVIDPPLEPPLEPPSERGEPRRGGGYEQPTGGRSNFELWSWVFMRISGLLLIFLALYHLVWWNLIVGVKHLDSQVVLDRWSHLSFRLLNVALITFAMLHGLNGARYSIEDYVHGRRARKVTKAIVYTLVLGALAFGIFALLTFDPSSLPANR